MTGPNLSEDMDFLKMYIVCEAVYRCFIKYNSRLKIVGDGYCMIDPNSLDWRIESTDFEWTKFLIEYGIWR